MKKAILKMAGYRVMCNPKKPSPNWWWVRHDEQGLYTEESCFYFKTEEHSWTNGFYFKTEEHSWTNAWKHYKQSIEGDKHDG